MINWKSLAALGVFALQTRWPTQVGRLMDQLSVRKTAAEQYSGKTYPHGSTKEAARRARHITKGQLTRSNGLVWPGQLISRVDGKLYIRRPYC
jgi:hypothetical protein